jgi:hypothetical protein
MNLSERTSTKGNAYLSGWLGKAQVVGFRGQPDKYGNPTWDLYVSEPEPRGEAPGDRRDGHRGESKRTRVNQSPGQSRSTAPPTASAEERPVRQRDGPAEASMPFDDVIPF